MAELEQEIKEIVSKVIKVPQDKLDPNANIFIEYGVESLLGVEILAALDKKYGVDVPDDKVRDIKSINDIVKMARDQIAKKK